MRSLVINVRLYVRKNSLKTDTCQKTDAILQDCAAKLTLAQFQRTILIAMIINRLSANVKLAIKD